MYGENPQTNLESLRLKEEIIEKIQPFVRESWKTSNTASLEEERGKGGHMPDVIFHT